MKGTAGVMIFLLFICLPVFAQGPPPAKVVVGKVVQEEVAESQPIIGILYYERTSEISTDTAGLVESVEVNQGTRVRRGDLLVRLNTEILEREILLTRTRMEQTDLRIDNARKNYNRLEKIFRESGISEKVYDDALYVYEDARKEKQAMAEGLEKLLIEQKRSLIRAPFDGIILTKDVDNGAWVQQGKKLLGLGSINDVYIKAPVPENLLQFVEIGGTVPVIINAFGSEVDGKVIDIDPVADIRTKNIYLKIKIPAMPLVAENMSATVHIPAGVKRVVSVLPRAAVIKFQGKDFVYTIKEGKAAILPLNIVAYMGEKVGVDNPYIVAGMEIVVEGNERLRPDQAVMVVGEE